MEKQIKKEYSKNDFKILWQPGKCIHSGICVQMLPKVYNPKEKPWVKPDNATVSELKAQIDKCPSGALSYNAKDENSDVENAVEIDVFENGPLLIHGNLKVKNKDGQIIEKEKATAFCRCGHSANKPFCDGKHKAAGFVG